MTARQPAQITQDRRATALPPDSELLREAFDDGPIAMAVLDLDGLIRYANPAMGTFCGQPAGALIGQPFTELVHPDDRAADQAEMAALVTGDRDPRTADRRFPTAVRGLVWA